MSRSPLENQTESLYSGAIGSFAPPQDLFQPVPMETSLASTPSFAELSSAASLAEVFDVSDAYAASPINSSCSEASDSAESSPSERGIAQEALSPPSLYMKQELATSTSESGPVATGAPFRRIQDMDPASRAELDRLLVAFRASGTPYKVIMDRLSHLYLGNHNTLRGRLRTLTLSPKMRVRNPVWEEHHVSGNPPPFQWPHSLLPTDVLFCSRLNFSRRQSPMSHASIPARTRSLGPESASIYTTRRGTTLTSLASQLVVASGRSLLVRKKKKEKKKKVTMMKKRAEQTHRLAPTMELTMSVDNKMKGNDEYPARPKHGSGQGNGHGIDR